MLGSFGIVNEIALVLMGIFPAFSVHKEQMNGDSSDMA